MLGVPFLHVYVRVVRVRLVCFGLVCLGLVCLRLVCGQHGQAAANDGQLGTRALDPALVFASHLSSTPESGSSLGCPCGTLCPG